MVCHAKRCCSPAANRLVNFLLQAALAHDDNSIMRILRTSELFLSEDFSHVINCPATLGTPVQLHRR